MDESISTLLKIFLFKSSIRVFLLHESEGRHTESPLVVLVGDESDDGQQLPPSSTSVIERGGMTTGINDEPLWKRHRCP